MVLKRSDRAIRAKNREIQRGTAAVIESHGVETQWSSQQGEEPGDPTWNRRSDRATWCWNAMIEPAGRRTRRTHVEPPQWSSHMVLKRS